MSDILDKMIADLKEGASRSEGFLRGGHVGVEVAREHRGSESKLASHPLLGPALGAGLGSGLNAANMGPTFGGPAMAALAASAQGGSAIGAGAGSYLGGSLGGLAGGALASALRLDPTIGAMAGHTIGSMGGAALGSGTRDERSVGDKIRDKLSGLGGAAAAFNAGAQDAAHHFKVAFLPLLGSLAGGALLRGGLGMAARRFGGNAVGRAAQGALNFGAKGGWRGNALDMAGSMAGGAAGNMLQGQPG